MGLSVTDDSVALLPVNSAGMACNPSRSRLLSETNKTKYYFFKVGDEVLT